MSFYNPSWKELRKIGQSKLIGLSILVPIIGYMIIFNEEFVHNFELSKEVFSINETLEKPSNNGISIESKSRLFYFYFGLTFLGLGSVLYKLRCPPLIRENSSKSAYVRNDSSLMTIKRIKSIINYLNNKVDQVYSEELNDIKIAINEVETSHHGSIPPITRERHVIDLMFMQWQYESLTKPISRWATLISYVFGFLILAIPTVQAFILVFSAFVNKT